MVLNVVELPEGGLAHFVNGSDSLPDLQLLVIGDRHPLNVTEDLDLLVHGGQFGETLVGLGSLRIDDVLAHLWLGYYIINHPHAVNMFDGYFYIRSLPPKATYLQSQTFGISDDVLMLITGALRYTLRHLSLWSWAASSVAPSSLSRHHSLKPGCWGRLSWFAGGRWRGWDTVALSWEPRGPAFGHASNHRGV